MAHETDIAVVGAGPAGSSCAALLAEQGYDVTLVDKDDFPREKACGDGLTPEAITVLKRLELSEFLDRAVPIDGYRVVLDHRRSLVSKFPSKGRCVPRASLDEQLVKVATERGARFVKGRVHGIEPVERGDTVTALLANDHGPSTPIRAKRMVASDGATSVLRRSVGLGVAAYSARAWALRGYYATEQPLDDFFDVYLPLEVGGEILVGYGWVFPVGDHTANIGVGYLRPGKANSAPRFSSALTAFVDELQVREAKRLGMLTPLGKPIGAPLAANFAAERCSSEKLVFVGDAAGLTDAFTGEGISAALDSGALAAKHVHRSLVGRGSLKNYGQALDRRMPRAGQDFSVLARTIARVNQARDLPYARAQEAPFLLSAAAIGLDTEVFANPGSSEVARLLNRVDPSAAALLEDGCNDLLDNLCTAFPFAKPIIAKELDAQGGPLYAASLLCSYQACGGDSKVAARLGSQASECLNPFASLISQLSDRPEEKVEKFNNALAILTADFAVSQSLVAVAEIGPAAAAAFAVAAQRVCEGGMSDVASRYDLARSERNYLAAAEGRVGSLLGFAAELGAEVAGAPNETAGELGRCGRMLGVAYRLAQDISEFNVEEDRARERLISTLKRGRYGLPLLLAIDRDQSIGQQLVRGPSSRNVEILLAAVRASGAIAAARERLGSCLHAAGSALECASPASPAGLEELSSWIEQQAGSA